MGSKKVVVLEWPVPLGVLEQNDLEPKKEGGKIKIKTSKGETIDNGYLWNLEKKLSRPVKAEDVKAMVDGIIGKLKPDGCLSSLSIVGHGSSGNISVGDGKLWRRNQHIDGNKGEWEDQLKRLCRWFCRDAKIIDIFLLGCHTGVCDDGAKKLHELARFFKTACNPDRDTPVFRVHGTKKTVYPDDVVEILEDGASSEDLVSVRSDQEAVPACLAPQPRDAKPKDKDKDKKDKGGESRPNNDECDKDATMKKKASFPRAGDYRAVGFRGRFGDPDAPVIFASPQPISVQELLGLFEFDEAFEPSQLGADIDGTIFLQRRDGETDELRVTLDYTAVVWDSGDEEYLYYLRHLDDAFVVRNLLEDACPC